MYVEVRKISFVLQQCRFDDDDVVSLMTKTVKETWNGVDYLAIVSAVNDTSFILNSFSSRTSSFL